MLISNKFKEQKSCSCKVCQYGSKKDYKKESHRAARKKQRMQTYKFLSDVAQELPVSITETGDEYLIDMVLDDLSIGAIDWEAGVHSAGYWD